MIRASLLFVILISFAQAASFNELVVFGDSLSDTGNRSVKRDQPDAKFRSTWVTILAGPAMLNVRDFKPSGMSFYYGGTNYAVGGASTEYTADLASERNRGQHLTQQVSRRYLNPAFNARGVRPEALHIVRIGGNDLLQALAVPSQFLLRWSRMEKAGREVAKSAEKQIAALAAAGAKHILWANLNDMSLVPSVIARANSMGGNSAPTILAALKQATLSHNQELDAAILRLKKAYPHVQIVKLDCYTFFADLARDPAKYGLDDVTTGANSDRHLFSTDGLHPSDAGYAYWMQELTRQAGRLAPSATP